jgi:hypothetical protein
MSHTGNNSWRTKAIEDELTLQACDECANPYNVAYSKQLERFIFYCANCNASCSTIVLEDGEEIEIR